MTRRKINKPSNKSKQAKQKLKPTPFLWRLRLVTFAIALVFSGIVARAAYIQVIAPDRLRHESDLRTLRLETRDVQRGMITDRNGEMLAVSVPVQAVWADPKRVFEGNGFDDPRRWRALADVLEVPEAELVERVKQDPKRRFLYLRRQVTPAVAEYIAKLRIPGVGLKPESRRYYPAGEATGQLIGLTNIDDKGIEGLERNYDDWLTGSPEKVRVRKGLGGEVVENLSVVAEGEHPNDLVLSLDMRLQSLAYRALKKATQYHMATSGSLVIIDIPTGEILAMANTPSFNPNQRSGIQAYQMRNRAITDAYEPGSVVKPLVVAAAMEKGLVTPDTVMDTSPGWMRVSGGLVRDTRNFGKQDVTHLLVKSSNIGMAKMALQMEVDELLAFYADFGLGTYSGINLDGETTGNVPKRRRWSEHERATLAFGYGLTSTPLQLARMYAILGANGVARPASILKLRDGQVPEGEQVLSPKVAKQMLAILTQVTEPGGTATRAAIDGYKVAGKTGTSRKAVAGGYGEDYVSLFAGLAPSDNPRLAMAVVINEPQGDAYYGGVVAAPVFSEVMAGALQLLNVEPSQRSPELGTLASVWGSDNVVTR
ncbi:peptidoglycan synthetase FtsI [Ferrimonas balearica DSM 9799]|uniref:Peptidoglycan D,D-transpeptidase FtsI n=1 Tax=Ferrimonas balearica (strain DSM 9799 / CCM 4581 / KCTC 23876 / PAT) TaxID=550540 RepID=E1SMJ9_FERBD|nr:peptidoglycan glycosyltransferase FtsI [Ferrimonas balearica]ADN74554.1 peptidoglycan synthetase FtsI [Ferrimonas balearica DSM 9799]MBY5981136.1 peptidoglycan glycosyltransferase FtsI [Ferrimonas balearica]